MASNEAERVKVPLITKTGRNIGVIEIEAQALNFIGAAAAEGLGYILCPTLSVKDGSIKVIEVVLAANMIERMPDKNKG